MSDELRKSSGTLKHGLKIGETTHRDFVMREPLAGDYIDAEADATPDKPTSYRTALIACQLESMGTFTGPFSLAMLKKLRGNDLAILLKHQRELEQEGEVEQPAAATG